VLTVIACVASCLLVLGFYGYVFLQLYREHRRYTALENRLREHLYEMEPKPQIKMGPSNRAGLPKAPKHIRKETLIQVGVAIGGLLGIFAEIGFLNGLINSFH